MAVKIEAWNIANGLTDPIRHTDILASVDAADADVIVFGEAYAENNPDILADSVDRLAELGYVTSRANYDDSDCRTHSQGLLVASRLSSRMQTIRTATRNALLLTIADQGTELTLGAVHFDDRKETTRLRQAISLVAALPREGPRAIAGDLNTMPRLWALGPLPKLANYLPVTEARPESHVPNDHMRRAVEKLYRSYSIGSRVLRMYSGSTLKYLTETQGYTDVDSSHLRTMPASRPLFQLDHILASAGIRTAGFRRHEATELSDHRAISATLSF